MKQTSYVFGFLLLLSSCTLFEKGETYYLKAAELKRAEKVCAKYGLFSIIFTSRPKPKFSVVCNDGTVELL